MRSEKQAAASRENGRQSHGDTTPEGKARIVNANLICGIDADTEVLTWEYRDDLEELKAEYYASHPPASPEARCFLDQVILCEWHLRRFAYAEASLWDQLSANCPDDNPGAYALEKGDRTLARLQHRINSTRRLSHRPERGRTPRGPRRGWPSRRPGRHPGRHPRARPTRNPFPGNPVTSSWESP